MNGEIIVVDCAPTTSVRLLKEKIFDVDQSLAIQSQCLMFLPHQLEDNDSDEPKFTPLDNDSAELESFGLTSDHLLILVISDSIECLRLNKLFEPRRPRSGTLHQISDFELESHTDCEWRFAIANHPLPSQGTFCWAADCIVLDATHVGIVDSAVLAQAAKESCFTEQRYHGWLGFRQEAYSYKNGVYTQHGALVAQSGDAMLFRYDAGDSGRTLSFMNMRTGKRGSVAVGLSDVTTSLHVAVNLRRLSSDQPLTRVKLRLPTAAEYDMINGNYS
jgi:hypothetical protein